MENISVTELGNGYKRLVPAKGFKLYNKYDQKYYSEAVAKNETGYEAVEDGTEYIAPVYERTLEIAKAEKVASIEAYDQSRAVNGFSVGGVEMWLDAPTRQQLRISLDACQAMGRESVSKWFDGVEYTFPTETWYQMLAAVEVYASDALNVTEAHKAAVNALEDIDEVDSYEYTTGYPQKLAF